MAKERVERTMSVGLPPTEAWERLTEVERVASWVPVLHEVTERSPLSAYDAVLADRVGPFTLKADLAIHVTRAERPLVLAIQASGEDRQVRARIAVEAALHLAAAATGTDLRLEGTYEVTGRVATLGASTIKAKAHKIVDEFCARAGKELV